MTDVLCLGTVSVSFCHVGDLIESYLWDVLLLCLQLDDVFVYVYVWIMLIYCAVT